MYRRPPRSDELYHFGVKGMKWGVRRYQPYPSGSTGVFLNQSRDNDIKIKKGSKAYRVQDSDIVSTTGQKYVSLDKLDSYAYVAATSIGFGVKVDCYDEKGKAKDNTLNIVSMEITNDMIAPSFNKTMETFINTVNDIGVKKVAKDVGTYPNGRYDRYAAKKFIENYKNVNSSKALEDAYLSFTQTFMQDTKSKNQFFDSLKKQGYSAIIDENDYYYGKGMTNTPTIIFDSSNVKQTKSEKVSGREIEYNDKRLRGKFNGWDVVNYSEADLKKQYKDVYKKYEPVYKNYAW